MNRPAATSGLRHVALYVKNLEETTRFYTDLVGMQVEWQPDPDNIYLTSGMDNLALHRASVEGEFDVAQRLDHIGFIMANAELVDEWYAFLLESGVEMKAKPRTHRDGARSFYCADPAGNIVQFIHHPPIADQL